MADRLVRVLVTADTAEAIAKMEEVSAVSDERALHGDYKGRDSLRLEVRLVGETGLEPATPSPPDWCATTCATPREGA